jgi:hypothetical protein
MNIRSGFSSLYKRLNAATNTLHSHHNSHDMAAISWCQIHHLTVALVSMSWQQLPTGWNSPHREGLLNIKHTPRSLFNPYSLRVQNEQIRVITYDYILHVHISDALIKLECELTLSFGYNDNCTLYSSTGTTTSGRVFPEKLTLTHLVKNFWCFVRLKKSHFKV